MLPATSSVISSEGTFGEVLRGLSDWATSARAIGGVGKGGAEQARRPRISHPIRMEESVFSHRATPFLKI